MALRSVALAVALLLGVAAPGQPAATTPAAIFVTWDGNPSTVVSIDWHLDAGTDVDALEVREPGATRWATHRGRAFPFPHSTRTVRRARVTGLRPGATYELRIGGSRVYRYRTMPARLTQPVRFAFENHDHAYKRTHPLRGGRRDATGVVYVGEGAWGAAPRPLGRDHGGEPAPYPERALSVNHGILVTVDRTAARLEVLDTRGTVVDTLRVARRRADRAASSGSGRAALARGTH